MDNLALVEAATGGPFTYRHEGATHTLPDPVGMPFQAVLGWLHEGDAPVPQWMPIWKRRLLLERWAAHYDLPDFESARRLAYLVDHYRSAIVYDLRVYTGEDLGELWRARRWRTLLDLIDHLPAHSWYSATVGTDEEHAEMIAKSLAAREAEGEKSPKGPALQTWTPEVAAITALNDSVNRLIYVTTAAAGDKKAKPPAPLPRPHTPLEAAMKRAQFERQKSAHDALTRRLLPHKR